MVLEPAVLKKNWTDASFSTLRHLSASPFLIALELTEILLLTPSFIEVVHLCSPGNIIIQVIIPVENIKKVHGKCPTITANNEAFKKS